MKTIDINLDTSEIKIISGVSGDDPLIIQVEDFEDYRFVIEPPHRFVCFKDSAYDPWTFSFRPGRYNEAGKGCAYTAESIETAEKEVPHHSKLDLYSVGDDPIYGFDVTKLAEDNDLTEFLIQDESIGGWGPTQELANFLNENMGLSALRVPSAKNPGSSCVNFYAEEHLHENFFKPVSSEDLD